MWDPADVVASGQDANIRESGCVKASGCHTNVKESECVDYFYIPFQVVTDQQANLWPDYVVKAIDPPQSLPHSPLLNYNVMAAGWDWRKRAYEVNSVRGGMDEQYIPWDNLASACI